MKELMRLFQINILNSHRLSVTKDSLGYNGVIYITYVGTTSFVEEDIVTVYGTVKGSKTYESQAGHQITLPLMEAEIIE